MTKKAFVPQHPPADLAQPPAQRDSATTPLHGVPNGSPTTRRPARSTVRGNPNRDAAPVQFPRR